MSEAMSTRAGKKKHIRGNVMIAAVHNGFFQEEM
jgi:hypothetical protein